MKEAVIWKVRPDDLRRMADSSKEVERQRKLLQLADELEAKKSELKV